MTARMKVSDLALSLRTSGEHVSLGGLPGLLGLANVRLDRLGIERGACRAVIEYAVDRSTRIHYGTGATLALALADACDSAAKVEAEAVRHDA